jgi:hypothetical protein
MVDSRVDGGGDLIFDGDVGGDRDGVTTPLLDQLQRLLGPIGVDVDDRDFGTLCGEELRRLPAKARARSGDQGNLAFEFHHPPLLACAPVPKSLPFRPLMCVDVIVHPRE